MIYNIYQGNVTLGGYIMKRPLYKRLASALLIAVLLIALNAVPVAAGAVEWEKPETITATASYVNPV